MDSRNLQDSVLNQTQSIIRSIEINKVMDECSLIQESFNKHLKKSKKEQYSALNQT